MLLASDMFTRPVWHVAQQLYHMQVCVQRLSSVLQNSNGVTNSGAAIRAICCSTPLRPRARSATTRSVTAFTTAPSCCWNVVARSVVVRPRSVGTSRANALFGSQNDMRRGLSLRAKAIKTWQREFYNSGACSSAIPDGVPPQSRAASPRASARFRSRLSVNRLKIRAAGQALLGLLP